MDNRAYDAHYREQCCTHWADPCWVGFNKCGKGTWVEEGHGDSECEEGDPDGLQEYYEGDDTEEIDQLARDFDENLTYGVKQPPGYGKDE